MSSSPTSAVGCTTVLTSRNRESPLQSHTFLNVPILSILLSKRAGVSSVLIGSLLGALQEQLHLQCGVPDDLARIIGGVECDQESITIATTRVPSFGCDMQYPVYGYRSLGPLSSLNLQIERPLPTIQLDREVMAIHSDDKPITKDFAQTWAPYGLNLETHFIVIFTCLSDSRRIGSLSRHSSFGYPAVPSPLFNKAVSTEWLRGLADASSVDISRANSPASAFATSLSNSPAPPMAHFLPSEPLQDAPNLVPGTDIEMVFRHFGIAEETVRAAKYVGSDRSLLSMVNNHQCMIDLIKRLGLHGSGGNFSATQTVAFTGGLVISSGDVVKYCGWTTESFKHKTTWYGWAEEAASKVWKGPIPRECALLIVHFVLLYSQVLRSRKSHQLPNLLYLAWDKIFLGATRSREAGWFPS